MNVYVIASEGGMCKIGKANDPVARLAQLSTGHPYKMRLAHTYEMPSQERALAVEAQAHRALSDLRMSGEWFSISAEDAHACIYNILNSTSPTTVRMPVSIWRKNELIRLAQLVADTMNVMLDAARNDALTDEEAGAMASDLERAAASLRDINGPED